MVRNYEKLPPESVVDGLLSRKTYLENAITFYKQELSKAPEGKLRVSTSNHTSQYYHVNCGTEKKEVYIPKSNQKLVMALAQKEYIEKIIPALEQELFHINETIIFMQKRKIDTIYNKLTEKRRQLVEPVTLSAKEYTENWLAVEYQHKPFMEDSANLFTAKGERVRSKSEVIIADTLFRLGIPYRYEFPIKLQKFSVHPDFYCLNLRNRKEFAWEHLGMMDSPEYASSAVEKLNAYENAGFFPGDKLIFSMETSSTPLSSKAVEKIARHYLL
ncbi:MAG: hypothetical protein KBT02_12830 [Treponema sp.]|nr:hypothetical protein [Candidatus Treponema caballi]